jgi:hypothetical protein
MNRSDGNRLPVQVRGREAATLRPTTDDEAPPPKQGRTATMVGPILLLCLGLLLGIVNQSAREVSGVLRVPALIAALILVGQALMMFDHPDPAPQRDVVVLPDGGDQVTVRVEGPPGRAAYRETTQRVAGAVRENVSAARDTKLVIWLGLVLAVWLGLATLANPTAPWLLVLLSLLASFLLFADAWRSLRGRR